MGKIADPSHARMLMKTVSTFVWSAITKGASEGGGMTAGGDVDCGKAVVGECEACFTLLEAYVRQ